MRLLKLCIVLLVPVLTGCASAPPSCDGAERRPVNQPPQAGAVYASCAASV